MISDFKLYNENFTFALNLLKERFEKNVLKQFQIQKHMNKLLKISSVSSLNGTLLLRSVDENMEAQIRSLQNLDLKSDTQGPVFDTCVIFINSELVKSNNQLMF